METILDQHQIQIRDLYRSVQTCPLGSLRFGPHVSNVAIHQRELIDRKQCYQFIADKVTRTQAADQCTRRFGNHSVLVYPENQLQQEFLTRNIQGDNVDDSAWLGIRASGDGFMSDDGRMVKSFTY